MELVYLPALTFVSAELAVNCIVASLVVVVVVLRVAGRRLGPGMGWDDGLILCATVCLSINAPSVGTANKILAFRTWDVGLTWS